jgi:hypothetical protein
MIHRPFHFVADSPALEAKLCALKQESCPHCGKVETLNRHSLLRGNDPDQPGAQSLRGQRVHCSDRGQRGGCGKTFALLLAEVFPRHTLSASRIWPWLVELLGGLSLKAASEKLRLPFALESFYRLRRRLGGRLDDLRSRLSREQAPPSSSHADPLLQTMEHLQALFPTQSCPPAAYQLHFQRPFLG